MLTADKNVLPDPGRGAAVCHVPPVKFTVPQVWRLELSCTKESGGAVETCTPLIVT